MIITAATKLSVALMIFSFKLCYTLYNRYTSCYDV